MVPLGTRGWEAHVVSVSPFLRWSYNGSAFLGGSIPMDGSFPSPPRGKWSKYPGSPV